MQDSNKGVPNGGSMHGVSTSAANAPLLKSAPAVSREARLQWLDAQIRDAAYPNALGMMEAFHVTRRTVFNDIHYLRHTLNAPLVFDRTRGGWRYTEPTFALPFLQLTPEEAASLRRALLAAEEFLGENDAQSLRRVTERFAPFLPTVAPLATETVGGALHLRQEERLGELITVANHSIARR